jgi:hypothetical protein
MGTNLVGPDYKKEQTTANLPSALLTSQQGHESDLLMRLAFKSPTNGMVYFIPQGAISVTTPNVGIKTPTPSVDFDVNGATRIRGNLATDAGAQFTTDVQVGGGLGVNMASPNPGGEILYVNGVTKLGANAYQTTHTGGPLTAEMAATFEADAYFKSSIRIQTDPSVQIQGANFVYTKTSYASVDVQSSVTSPITMTTAGFSTDDIFLVTSYASSGPVEFDLGIGRTIVLMPGDAASFICVDGATQKWGCIGQSSVAAQIKVTGNITGTNNNFNFPTGYDCTNSIVYSSVIRLSGTGLSTPMPYYGSGTDYATISLVPGSPDKISVTVGTGSTYYPTSVVYVTLIKI